MLRRNVGYVFQNPSSQIIGATVEEDVAFSLEILGIDRDEMQRRIKGFSNLWDSLDWKKRIL